MIDVFISPTSNGHPPYTPPKPPQPPPSLNGTDLMLFKALQRHGRYGSLIWPLLNEVAAEQEPADRAEAREIRLELWRRLRGLIKAGVVHWYTRKSISIYDLPRHYVNRRRRSRAGSTLTSKRTSETCQKGILVSNSAKNKLLPDCSTAAPPQPLAAITQSALAAPSDPLLPTSSVAMSDAAPTPCQDDEQANTIRQAARELARLPRSVKKQWSGYVNGVRIWRNRRIQLPNGDLAFAYGALRGKLIWNSCETGLNTELGDDWTWDVIDADQVRLVKNPHAVALGRMKAGVREKVSEAKSRAARTNGLKPCKSGRQRGRPRSLQSLPTTLPYAQRPEGLARPASREDRVASDEVWHRGRAANGGF